MKVQTFAYNVSMRTMELLEETQHYKIPETTRKQILEQIQNAIDALIKDSK